MEDDKEVKTEINSDDIKAMEDDARRASQSEARDIADDVEKKVRKEVEQENTLKKLQEDKVQQDEALKKIKEDNEKMLESLKGEFETKLKNIEDSRKSTVNTDNPFRDTHDEDQKKEILQKLKDPAEMDAMEEESRRQFLKKNPSMPDGFGHY